MEQKTLIAIILSVLVLFSYETIFEAPKRAKMLREAQVVVNKEVNNPSSNVTAVFTKYTEETKSASINEKKWDLTSTNKRVSLSNVGGSIHNIQNITGHTMPVTGLLTIVGYEHAVFELKDQSASKTTLVHQEKGVRIVKTFEQIDQHAFKVRMEIVYDQNATRMDNIAFNLINLNSEVVDPANKRETMLDEYSVFSDKKVVRKGNAVKFNTKENKRLTGQLNWAAFRDHYTAIVIKPEFKTKAFDINVVTENSLNISAIPENKNDQIFDFTIYYGPQDATSMKKYGKEFEKVVAFFNWAIMDAVAKVIYYTIPILHSIFHSWGISIILISLIIYGLTYPLTIKSMMSMRKMQQMQPKIKALQDRYKNEPQKLNAEIMEIYKREKINPLGGCLPFLLQMPIFIALYQVLWRSFYFQGNGFLWIKDLALPDRLLIMPFSVPFLGNEFNILPLLMGIVMFFQQKLSSKNAVVTDEQQAMQQKMMMYFFPFFIGFIFYKFASGLSLYFTVFYLLSTLTQWKMSKVK